MVSHTRIVIIYPARETETAYAGSGIFFPLVKLGILKLVNDQPNGPECIDRQLIPFAWSPAERPPCHVDLCTAITTGT